MHLSSGAGETGITHEKVRPTELESNESNLSNPRLGPETVPPNTARNA